MSEAINKKTLTHLAELARIELKGSEEDKIIKDLGKILGHFEELKEVDTDNILPMTGGTFSKNVFRKDEPNEDGFTKDKAAGTFPEKENGFLKIPPVF